MRSGKIEYVLVKEVVVRCRKNDTTAKILMTKIYIQLWHICLIMTNFLQFEIDQLGFRLTINVSYDATGFGFYYGFVRRYG